MNLELLLPLAGAVGLVGCAVVSIFSPKLRKHLQTGIATFKDADTKRHERALLALAVGLLLIGPLLIGPLDEIIAILIIARLVKKVAARKTI